MKRALIGLTLAGLMLAASNPLFATEIAAPGTPVRKLQRGFLNLALSPIDIFVEASRDKRDDSFAPTWFTGAGRGVFFMAGRALSGVYDIVTAPVPMPAGYEPLVSPEFPWQNLQELPAAKKK